MKRVIVTNNKKVKSYFAERAELIMLENKPSLQVLVEGEKIASKGGRLLIDPTRKKGYYKSLVFYLDDEMNQPDEKSISLLKKCMEDTTGDKSPAANKESILAGILQNRDLNMVKSIFH